MDGVRGDASERLLPVSPERARRARPPPPHRCSRRPGASESGSARWRSAAASAAGSEPGRGQRRERGEACAAPGSGSSGCRGVASASRTPPRACAAVEQHREREVRAARDVLVGPHQGQAAACPASALAVARGRRRGGARCRRAAAAAAPARARRAARRGGSCSRRRPRRRSRRGRGGGPRCRDVIACERSERTRAASSSSAVRTMPPSPTQSCFLEKNERQPSRPTVPAWPSGVDVARRSPGRRPRSARARAPRRARAAGRGRPGSRTSARR